VTAHNAVETCLGVPYPAAKLKSLNGVFTDQHFSTVLSDLPSPHLGSKSRHALPPRSAVRF
jgi:hypothetical protein